MSIYFIRAGDDGPVKIGVAGNVAQRLGSLQGAHHQKLILLRTIDGSYAEEGWLHRYFMAHRQRGEWFLYRDDMLTIIPQLPVVSRRPGTKPEKKPRRPFVRAAPKPDLMRAINILGGIPETGRQLAIRPSAIWNVLGNQGRGIPRGWCLRLEKLTRGKVTAAQLRADLFS